MCLKNGLETNVKKISVAACETGAIVFGDINDKDSKVLELKEDDRMYHLAPMFLVVLIARSIFFKI